MTKNPDIFTKADRIRKGLAGIRGSQADRVIGLFGGARRLARTLTALGHPTNPSTVFRWTYPKHRQGTDGMIPTRTWPHILKAARYEGIFLTPDVFDPRVQVPEYEEPLDILG